jgi:hypothetical protein
VVQTDECNFPELAAAGGAWECRPELEALEKTLRMALTAEDAERTERGLKRIGRKRAQRAQKKRCLEVMGKKASHGFYPSSPPSMFNV